MSSGCGRARVAPRRTIDRPHRRLAASASSAERASLTRRWSSSANTDDAVRVAADLAVSSADTSLVDDGAVRIGLELRRSRNVSVPLEVFDARDEQVAWRRNRSRRSTEIDRQSAAIGHRGPLSLLSLDEDRQQHDGSAGCDEVADSCWLSVEVEPQFSGNGQVPQKVRWGGASAGAPDSYRSQPSRCSNGWVTTSRSSSNGWRFPSVASASASSTRWFLGM